MIRRWGSAVHVIARPTSTADFLIRRGIHVSAVGVEFGGVCTFFLENPAVDVNRSAVDVEFGGEFLIRRWITAVFRRW